MEPARNLDPSTSSGLRNQLEYLYGLKRFGVDPGLADMEAVMAALGNPERSLRVIHVGGTNGKGSVAAMVESVLRAAGYRVGLHSSPHMYAFNERLQIDRVPVSDAEALRLIDMVRGAMSRAEVQLTFAEFTTAMALLHFAQQHVDWAVIEVAMGGRFDATNVVAGEIAVITNIGHDHQEFLGSTTREIAREKAGIIKRGAAVVTGEHDQAILEYFAGVCAKRDARLVLSADMVTVARTGHDWRSQTVRADGVWQGTYRLPLLGEHQLANAATALTALAQLRERGETITEAHLEAGLGAVRWEGRLDVVGERPLIIVDGAHNREGFEALAHFIKGMPRRDVLVIGVKEGRDVVTLRDTVIPLFEQVVTTEGVYQPEQSEVLAAKLRTRHRNVIALPDPSTAVQHALAEAGKDGSVVVAGSLYMIPEALAYLRQREIVSPLIP